METYQSNAPASPKPALERKLKVEAVTVCVDYSDFLAHSILFNKQHFDRWVIVTTPTDEATRRLCEYHNLEYVPTTAVYEDEGWQPPTYGQGRMYRPPFAKGKGVNVGLKALQRDGWVVHMDADIILPPRTREMMELAKPDPTFMYGIDRLMAKNYEEWVRHLAYPEIQHDANIFVRANSFPFNVRVATHRDAGGGYIPIGFFQMWNPSVSKIHDYPQNHTSAGRTDMQHAQRWPRERRGIIPEIVGIHLESEEVQMAANWNGRTTRFFGPKEMERHTTQFPRKEWL